MLLALLITFAEPASPGVVPEIRDKEIIVVAQRFAKWRGVVRMGKQGWSCKTRQTSGSKAIDAKSCEIFIGCITEERARSDVPDIFTDAKTKPPQDRLDRIGACVEPRRNAAIDAFAAGQRE